MFTRKTASVKSKVHISRSISLIITVCCLICATTQGTVAWLTKNLSVSNMFLTGSVDVKVEEVFDIETLTKRDVAVKNDGNSPVYVRAAVSIFWEDAAGYILDDTPVPAVDYALVWNTASANWFYDNGIYYYQEPLAAETTSDILIQSCKQLQHYEDGRILVVDVACQSIQATPPRAVEEAWGVTVGKNGDISK